MTMIDPNQAVFAYLILKRRNWSFKKIHERSIITTLVDKGANENKISVNIVRKSPDALPCDQIVLQFKLDSNCIPRMQV